MKQLICALLALMLLISGGALAQEPDAPDAAKPTSAESASTGAIAPAEVVTADTPEATKPAQEEAAAEQPRVTLAFEDGFSLELPADWLHYEVSDEMARSGVLYCLSDAAAERWLYIQSWTTDCADIDALCALIRETSQPQTSGVYEFNGTQFVVYDLTEGDVSCCAALLDDRVLNFVFTPQSDSDFMVIAARIIGTFTAL